MPIRKTTRKPTATKTRKPTATKTRKPTATKPRKPAKKISVGASTRRTTDFKRPSLPKRMGRATNDVPRPQRGKL
jgi:hypothetical protein